MAGQSRPFQGPVWNQVIVDSAGKPRAYCKDGREAKEAIERLTSIDGTEFTAKLLEHPITQLEWERHVREGTCPRCVGDPEPEPTSAVRQRSQRVEVGYPPGTTVIVKNLVTSVVVGEIEIPEETR